MKKTLILLILGSFSIQLSAMSNDGDRPVKKQKVSDIELKEKTDNKLAEQQKKWEEYYNQEYKKYENGSYFKRDNAYLFKNSNYDHRLLKKNDLLLQFAVIDGYIELTAYALDKVEDPNMELIGEDRLVLSFAICLNHKEIVSLLFNHPKIDVNN